MPSRPHAVPPDPERYAEIVEWVMRNYGRHVAVYEICNEADIMQFWRGTFEEYLAFAEHVHEILVGPAGVNPRYLSTMLPSDVSRQTALIPLHPYAAQSVGWDLPYGLLQSLAYNLGIDQEIYCNESGFVWRRGGEERGMIGDLRRLSELIHLPHEVAGVWRGLATV